MTNKISKAREAISLATYTSGHGESDYCIKFKDYDGQKHFETILHILTTLSSIDAERLGYVLDKPNPKPQKDWDVIVQAAATLHGLVRGDE